MDFIVTPAVLIPRPETEHVIEVVLELCKADLGPQTSGPKTSTENRTPDVRSPKSEVRVADIGTGSGCIAVALAKEFPDAEIHATDISSAALQIARANAARHQLENRIHFHRTDLLEGLIPQTFDLIVSNPPYVGESEEDRKVQLEVRKFEPPNAEASPGPPESKSSRALHLIPQAPYRAPSPLRLVNNGSQRNHRRKSAREAST